MGDEDTLYNSALERAKTPALIDEIRAGLGTEEMTLEEMLAELRRIREAPDDVAMLDTTATDFEAAVRHVREMFAGREFSDSTELIREDRER